MYNYQLTNTRVFSQRFFANESQFNAQLEEILVAVRNGEVSCETFSEILCEILRRNLSIHRNKFATSLEMFRGRVKNNCEINSLVNEIISTSTQKKLNNIVKVEISDNSEEDKSNYSSGNQDNHSSSEETRSNNSNVTSSAGEDPSEHSEQNVTDQSSSDDREDADGSSSVKSTSGSSNEDNFEGETEEENLQQCLLTNIIAEFNEHIE